ncbi:MAG: hypothetical protein ABL930_01020 [Pseudobdellovibrio sp.]
MKCIKYAALCGFLFFFTSCTLMLPEFSCKTEDAAFNSGDLQVNITTYKKETKSFKSLIVLPPTGGTNIIDKSYAKKFCAQNYDVYVVNGWSDDKETKSDLTIHQHFYSRAQKAISLTLDNIHTPFIGLLGTSIGALHASVAANTQTKIDSVFIIVGGAPIAEVIVSSNQDAMVNLKAERKKRFGFKSDNENIAAISKVFSLEPMNQGELYKTKDIGMSVATEDSVVKAENQNKLKNFFKPQAVFNLSNDHFWGIINTWLFHDSEVIGFFEKSYSKRKSQ